MVLKETQPVPVQMINDSIAFPPLSFSDELGNQSFEKVLTPGRKLPDIQRKLGIKRNLKVHKIENFFDSDFGICVISLLVISNY